MYLFLVLYFTDFDFHVSLISEAVTGHGKLNIAIHLIAMTYDLNYVKYVSEDIG